MGYPVTLSYSLPKTKGKPRVHRCEKLKSYFICFYLLICRHLLLQDDQIKGNNVYLCNRHVARMVGKKSKYKLLVGKMKRRYA
jgi:hypothetical protein